MFVILDNLVSFSCPASSDSVFKGTFQCQGPEFYLSYLELGFGQVLILESTIPSLALRMRRVRVQPHLIPLQATLLITTLTTLPVLPSPTASTYPSWDEPSPSVEMVTRRRVLNVVHKISLASGSHSPYTGTVRRPSHHEITPGPVVTPLRQRRLRRPSQARAQNN